MVLPSNGCLRRLRRGYVEHSNLPASEILCAHLIVRSSIIRCLVCKCTPRSPSPYCVSGPFALSGTQKRVTSPRISTCRERDIAPEAGGLRRCIGHSTHRNGIAESHAADAAPSRIAVKASATAAANRRKGSNARSWHIPLVGDAPACVFLIAAGSVVNLKNLALVIFCLFFKKNATGYPVCCLKLRRRIPTHFQ